MTYHHIRLREPWLAQPPADANATQHVLYCRNFNRPTGLALNQPVWLQLSLADGFSQRENSADGYSTGHCSTGHCSTGNWERLQLQAQLNGIPLIWSNVNNVLRSQIETLLGPTNQIQLELTLPASTPMLPRHVPPLTQYLDVTLQIADS